MSSSAFSWGTLTEQTNPPAGHNGSYLSTPPSPPLTLHLSLLLQRQHPRVGQEDGNTQPPRWTRCTAVEELEEAVLKLVTPRLCHNNSKATPISKLRSVHPPNSSPPVWPISNNLNSHSTHNRDNHSKQHSPDTVVDNLDQAIPSKTVEEEWTKCRINSNR